VLLRFKDTKPPVSVPPTKLEKLDDFASYKPLNVTGERPPEEVEIPL